MLRQKLKKVEDSSLGKYFTDISTMLDRYPQYVFRKMEFERIFARFRVLWNLDKKIGFDDFVEYLSKNGSLLKYYLMFPGHPTTIFTWGKDRSIFEIVLAVGRGAYLSHFTAVFIHQLTEQVPKTIYVTVPQPEKRNDSIELTQEEIDAALSRPTKPTNQYAQMGKFRVARLAGMDTQSSGIIKAPTLDGGVASVTTIERTLIDIVVRPNYCGGIQQVLDVYSFAKGRISGQRIADLLKKLEYLYPYHQAIGLYMERAGYPKEDVHFLHQMGIKRDFYLAHGMRDKDYSSKWRLFFPKGF
jgi:AbiEi antitoxin C-terminal domain